MPYIEIHFRASYICTAMSSDDNDPLASLLTCPHCKTQCSSTTDLFNHMSFPGNHCSGHLGMDFDQFKRRFKTRQQLAMRNREDYNRRHREAVSTNFHLNRSKPKVRSFIVLQSTIFTQSGIRKVHAYCNRTRRRTGPSMCNGRIVLKFKHILSRCGTIFES